VLIEERVRRRLSATTRFTDIELLEVTDSTNRLVAARAANGAPEGLVVAADLQTAGRGRLGRSWNAERGTALLVSVLLRPKRLPLGRWYLLTAAAGLAARQACHLVAGFRPELKWPNDLLIGGRKLAGILAETEGGAVVIGMGLNVHAAPPRAASVDEVAGRWVDRSALLGAWLAGLDGYLEPSAGAGPVAQQWEALAATYRQACSTVGQMVVVDLGNCRLVGLAEGIDDEGRLVVQPEHGPAQAVAAGDVTQVRPASGAWEVGDR
jgi:BirA family biotin operon repressor/biotin-[acetyl-CoA-carboxylase] ligase